VDVSRRLRSPSSSWPGGVRTITTGLLPPPGSDASASISLMRILTSSCHRPGRSDPSLSQCLDVGRHMHYACPVVVGCSRGRIAPVPVGRRLSRRASWRSRFRDGYAAPPRHREPDVCVAEACATVQPYERTHVHG
jgi:hypothetical protein